MYLVTSDQMQALDNHTIHALFVPGIVLMDHAGKAVADKVRHLGSKHVVVCTGKGNNGGDGWVAARWCQHYGIRVEVLAMNPPDEAKGDAAAAAKAAVQSGVPWQMYRGEAELPGADLYVDALLGTGADRPLRGDLLSLVTALNASGQPVLAVDIPTGVNPNTGEVATEAVQAAFTVCLAAQKLGTAVSPGCHFAGTVEVADIGIPTTQLVERHAMEAGLAKEVAMPSLGTVARATTREQLRRWLPKRVNESHKGTYGRLAIAIGEMQGAAVLAGMGASRVGAGLVVLTGQRPLVMHAPPEFVVQVQPETSLEPPATQALVVGPGLGSDYRRWQKVLAGFEGPCVVDADGLQLLSQVKLPHGRVVVTPHPKECARMLGWSTEEVQAHRLHAATELALKTGAIVVLKGYHSLVVSPDGRIQVNPTGDASLATAGTGDILAGMIGGLLAQAVDPFEAAAAGAFIHGLAGELAGELRTPVSTTASDVVDSISRAIRAIST